MKSATKRTIITLLFLLIILFSSLKWITNLYVDWLWFSTLNYQDVFLKIFFSDIGFKAIVGLVAFLLIFINLLPTKKLILKAAQTVRPVKEEENIYVIQKESWRKYISSKFLSWIYFLGALFLAFAFSASATGKWQVLQNFLNSTPFDVLDPIFNKDIGFYVFNLPFYEYLYSILIGIVIIMMLCTVIAYLLIEMLKNPGQIKLFKSEAFRLHISSLAAIFFAALSWGYLLKEYTLLYSQSGNVYGAGYSDIHATLFAYKALVILSLVCAIAILINVFLRKFKLVMYTVGFLLVVSIVLGGVYPALMQKFIVVPNELSRETPYIENSIEFTRMAYGLDKVEKKSFPAGNTLTPEDVQNNPETIENIRLWDYRPLQQTYSQLQEMRSYYELSNIDVDRYMIDGRYRQVMLSAREMDEAQAKTWINQRLKYTHGYGIVMTPVNEISSEGLPNLFIKDIPPVSSIDLEVTRPEIYFGEQTNNYVLVNTEELEFDYPKGENNSYTTYEGKDGIKINNILKRLVFAFNLTDYKILLSGEITNESQILLYRNIKDRVTKIAPFLHFDSDPYIVIDNGKLYWLWDAYTVTNRFPYSEPFSGELNYIRNSVKIVIDAYTGETSFYVSDTTDPIIKTYSKIFPNMFLPLEEMPDGLKDHVRYPEDLFAIQSQKYAVYHMENPEVFYNKEDKWTIPTEMIYDEEVDMESYYTIVKLPGEEEKEYIQIIPFNPQGKKNMIAWMAGRSDGEYYGKLLVYEFPKQELVYGPIQVEAKITSDPYISQQVALWNQSGSQVLRGNLMIIPIEDSLLYVEPLYLQAEQSKIPELRRVVLVHGEKVVMGSTLQEALESLFGNQKATDQNPIDLSVEAENQDINQLIQRANDIYLEAENSLKVGDWTAYGKAQNELEAILNQLLTQSNTVQQ